jgi:hypothetical protein
MDAKFKKQNENIEKSRRTWRSWDAVERLSTSTSRHWSRKSSNNGDNFSRPAISGFPFVAIR